MTKTHGVSSAAVLDRRSALTPTALVLLALALLAMGSPTGAATPGAVQYSPSSDTLVLSFREIWPEFADQDPTPMVRVYGDGRVVVHQPAYMRKSGVFEMWLSKTELDALLLEVTPVLLAFDEPAVRTMKQESEALLRLQAEAAGEPSVFVVTDAEISLFYLDVESYRPAGASTTADALPAFVRQWRGLRYDAERHEGVGPIQDLKRAEDRVRALCDREELAWVAAAAP